MTRPANSRTTNPPEEQPEMIALPSFLALGRAACTADPDLFHSTAPGDEEAAKRICGTCPLLAACREHALGAGEERGTWGGLAASERRRLLSDDGTWLDAQGRVRRLCGNEAAFLAHRRYDELCETCEAAHDARVLADRRRLLAAAHDVGGTPAGAALHRRLGEPVCTLCRGSVARQSAARRAARQAPAQALTQGLAA